MIIIIFLFLFIVVTQKPVTHSTQVTGLFLDVPLHKNKKTIQLQVLTFTLWKIKTMISSEIFQQHYHPNTIHIFKAKNLNVFCLSKELLQGHSVLSWNAMRHKGFVESTHFLKPQIMADFKPESTVTDKTIPWISEKWFKSHTGSTPGHSILNYLIIPVS